jgi:hypothetical protein
MLTHSSETLKVAASIGEIAEKTRLVDELIKMLITKRPKMSHL